MTSIRLTNLDRDRIVARAMEGVFKDRRAALDVKCDALARRCYETVFSAGVRKAVMALPDGWCRLDACLRFNVGGLDVRLDLIGGGVPVPAVRLGYCGRLGSIVDEALVEEVCAYLAENEEFEAEQRRAQSSLKGLLYSLSTLKALRETWPEGEPYYGSLASKTGAPGVPAPQIAELNAMLGLERRAA